MEHITKQMQEAADKMKAMVPQITFNKNGYEIRTQVLEIAANVVNLNYQNTIAQVTIKQAHDAATGELVQTVEFPTAPGVAEVLDAAQKFYDFIQGAGKTK